MASLPTPFKIPRTWSSAEAASLFKRSRRTVSRLVLTGRLRARRETSWERGPDGKGRKIVRYRISSKAIEDYYAGLEAAWEHERLSTLHARHAVCPTCKQPLAGKTAGEKATPPRRRRVKAPSEGPPAAPDPAPGPSAPQG